MTIKEKLGFSKEEEFKLGVAIDNYLNSKENVFRERDYFYVSELGKTDNEIYDTFINKKPFKADARVKRLLDLGNYIHEQIIKYLVEMGILVCSEVDVGDDLFHGRLDVIITDGEKNYVLEIKSCSMWTFNKLTEPSVPHNIQIQFYMYYSRIKDGIVLYKNKDNSAIKCFSVKLDMNLINTQIERFKKIRNTINSRIPPNDKPIKLEELEYDK